jgi:type IV pilus assembly protein PilM
MPLLNKVTRLLQDPPPAWAFELSEEGIAVVQGGKPPVRFEPLEPDVLRPSPIRDNILQPDLLAARVKSLAPRVGGKKRVKAALILPDYAVRVTVVDFDSFPTKEEEQRSLVRFRLKRSMPFDVDTAMLSYYPQGGGKGKRIEVITAVAPLEIVARYEAPFRAAGFHPGQVTTSTLAALQMVIPEGIAVFAKLSGRILTLAVLDGATLKLVRCVELGDGDRTSEIFGQLFPTFAFIEDQLGGKASRLVLAGFGPMTEEMRGYEAELGVTMEPLQSPFGPVQQSGAGLLGYLQALEEAA